jgi:hypothetical protein
MAEKMPEADYGYKPHEGSRMFGQLFAHAANSMYGSCAALKGVANPNQGKNLEELLKTKPEFVKAINDAYAFCDDAIKGLTDANVAELVKQGQNEVARGSIVAATTSHNNEMYGTGAAYMRAKGLVPPSTERAQRRKPELRVSRSHRGQLEGPALLESPALRLVTKSESGSPNPDNSR